MEEAKKTKPEAKVASPSKEVNAGRPKNFKRQNSRKRSFNKNAKQQEFEKEIISIRRVARTYSGGKRMRISVCLVVGDRKGRVGIAMGKGADVISAEEKAFNKAKKNLKTIQLKGKTIAHEILYKKGACKIMLKPAAPGTGVVAGSALSSVLKCVGIEDILTKVLGAKSSINNAYACVEALQNIKKMN